MTCSDLFSLTYQWIMLFCHQRTQIHGDASYEDSQKIKEQPQIQK